MKSENSSPLTPLQRGMLFHALYARQPGVDIEQVHCALREEVIDMAFVSAWQRVVDRHEALRTCFRWEHLDDPVQETRPTAQICFVKKDWRGVCAAEQSDRLRAFLQADRQHGFDLASPPLMRVTLFQLGELHFEFVWTFHHILLDGRSIGLVLNEVLQLNEAFARGEVREQKAARSYGDYLAWLQKKDWAASEPYWRQQLAGFTSPTPLVINRSAPEPALGFQGEQEIKLSAAITGTLRSIAREHGFTINTMVQGAWALLLSHYSGEDDVVFGAVRACRRSTIEGAESTVGLFINTLPMRVRVPLDAALLPWLADLRATWIEMRHHEHAPLVSIQAWSELPPAVRLFETIFNFQDPSWADELCAQGGAWSNRTFRIYGQSNYPLAVDASAGAEVILKILYHRSSFEDSAIIRMLGHFKSLLEGMAANPGQKLAELWLVTGPERRQLLLEWNQTEAEFPRDKCVHELFEAQAARTPDGLAVADDRRQLSYGALNQLAGRLAHHLRTRGVGPDVCVGVCMERSVEMVIALLAVLKAGGAYVPLDPACPKERLAFMLADAKVPVLLIQEKRRAELDINLPHLDVISVDEIDQVAALESTVPGIRSSNLAYVIYTSGSTGVPKGVEIEHFSLVNLITWHQRIYSVTPLDRATQLAAPAFDASVWELWPYLTTGASIHIPDEETRLSSAKLIAWLCKNKISLAFVPTPLAEAMLGEVWPDNCALRALLTGGDKLRRPPDQRLPCKLLNHYGPTENTVVTSWAAVLPDNHSAAPHIGRPISNIRLYVLDRWRQTAPVGVPGELHIGGVGLARGYRNRRDLTAAKFIADPFSDDPGARLYQTGDLVRYRPDGNLEYLGRMDGQLKIRGNRIELGEIESLLGQHPDVREAVVVLRPATSGGDRLVAYIIPDPENQPSPRALREYLKQKLPDYMIPSAFLLLEALPLTRNGKLDRDSLPVPKTEQAESFSAPRTPVEEMLAAIWCEVLGLERAGRHDNFFDLGGHSLLATQVMARVRRRFHLEVSLHRLFEAPTIAGLAVSIESALRGLAEGIIPPLKRHSGEEIQNLSFAQERLWFLEQLEPGQAFNNIPLVIHLAGPLNLTALIRGFNEIIRRHKPLRTIYESVNGRPVATVLPARSCEVFVEDLSQHPPEEAQNLAKVITAEEARLTFDLSRGPVVRVKLLRLRADEHQLLLTTHHIACDGWSMGVLYRELAALYDAFSQGGESPLPELAVDYADFVHWQRSWLQGAVLEKQLTYWKRQLRAPLPVLDLMTDRQRPPVQTYRGATHSLMVPPVLSVALKTLARREEITLFMLLIGALQTLLHRYTGQEDILIGTPIAGRTHVEAEPLIGMFLNSLVLRGDLSGNPSFTELLQRIRRTALDAYAHQDLPFEKLVDELKLERDLSRPPLFQVMFVLQNEPLAPLELRGLGLKPLPAHSGTSKFDLTISLEETGGGIAGCVEFNADLFLPETIARFAGHFRTLLESIAADPSKSLSQLEMLPGPERDQLLYNWNHTYAGFTREKCVHQLIEEQTARTPESVALVFEDQELSYRELNRRADALAHELEGMGVGPDVCVAICVKRSLEMMVGLLGILKAGGCYVPLDPTYPKDRLAFMLENSQAAVLLTLESLQAGFKFEIPHLKLLCLDAPRFVTPAAHHNPELPPVFRRRHPQLTSDNLAYVIYTSGSTGRPKGVMLTHRNVVNFFAGMDRVLGVEPGVWLAVTSISFDISVLELFWTLAHGFKVIIQSDEDRIATLDDDGLKPANGQRRPVPEQIIRHGVTHLQCTPSLAGTLAMTSQSLEALRRLGKLLLGGEALPVSLAGQLRQGLRGDLINMYGPTETTVWSATHRVQEINGSIPLGRPVANTQIYLLDQQLQPVPLGVPGEIFIAGEGVARGYLNRPELTAEKFLRDPFLVDARARMYRTGDLGRRLPDGIIEFLGRLDQQVKLRGFRIELNEIETLLRENPGVADCVVRVWDVSPNDRRLIAYVVPAPRRKSDENLLRRHLKEHLPEYMVPALFITLESLPLTPNGKVDRKALPLPTEFRPAVETAFVAPHTSLEREIAKVWCSLLHVEKAGLADNFFDLGGHSLLMVRMQASLRDDLGIDLPVVRLFQYPTIGALAKFLTEREQSDSFHRINDRALRQREAFARRHQPEIVA